MIRSIRSGLFALVSVTAIGLLPAACSTGGIGDPCTPEDEYNPTFGGFKLTQENIESRSFQCESRICLVNFFQGRVSCPAGQLAPQVCTGPNDGSCGSGDCVESGTFAPECTEDSQCAAYAGVCDPGGFCTCADNSHCPVNFVCDTDAKQCKQFVCHDGECQDPALSPEENAGKACCIPGTNTPVAAGVCGQCGVDNKRDAAGSVYCSCRCGVAEGEPEDENFNFCECPDGFACTEIRRNVGLGDAQLTGKFCVRADDPIIEGEKVAPATAASLCGDVAGAYPDSDQCKGTPTGG